MTRDVPCQHAMRRRPRRAVSSLLPATCPLRSCPGLLSRMQTTTPGLGRGQLASSPTCSGYACRSTSAVSVPGVMSKRACVLVPVQAEGCLLSPQRHACQPSLHGCSMHARTIGLPNTAARGSHASHTHACKRPHCIHSADASISDFYGDERVKLLFRHNLCQLANRVSTRSGAKYKDSHAILAWDLISEPR